MSRRSRTLHRLSAGPKKYSFKRDLVLFLAVIILFFYLFYRFVYAPVFGLRRISGNGFKIIYDVYEIRNGSELKYVQTVSWVKGKIFVETSTTDSKSRYLYDENGIYQATGKKVRFIDKSLNPLSFPFSPALCRFLLENREVFVSCNVDEESFYLGRKAIECELKDSFKPKRKYSFIFDAQSYLPMFIEVAENGRTIYRLKGTYFLESSDTEKEPFRLEIKNAEDVYSSNRLQADEVQGAVPFSVYPPGWLPLELKKSGILLVKGFRLPLASFSINSNAVVFSYYNAEKFVQIIEFRGNPPFSDKSARDDFKARRRVFKLSAIPGAFVAWGKDGENSLLIIGNLDRNTIIRVAEGLFE